MFWGISSLSIASGVTRSFNFQSNYFAIGGSLTTNYTTYTNLGTYSIKLSHFFIARRSCTDNN